MTYFCVTCNREHDGLPTGATHPTCSTCAHWKPPVDRRYANFNPNCGQCQNPRLTQAMLKPDAVCTEGEEHYGTLWVGPLFYCKHHEAA